MRSPAMFLATTAVLFPTYAFQLPFSVPFLTRGAETTSLPGPQSQEIIDTAVPNRIAIIGAGAAGSSAAFWIAKAKERYGLDVNVDVYDRNHYVGGRSTSVYPYGDDTLQSVELGGSIFVEVNKNLWRAVDEFGLQRMTDEELDDGLTGIWNGKEFVITMGGSGLFSSWWDQIKILWRYGYSAPTKTQSLVEKLSTKLMSVYEPSAVQWSNISALVLNLEWSDVVAQTATEYLDAQGVDKRFTRELVDAATRVNYGQNADQIHAVEGLCSLATDGATGVKGGNYQIFEHFIAASKATLYLNTTVQAVKRLSSNGPWQVFTTSSSTPRLYRSVILAAPYHQTGITFSSTNALAPVAEQPYVHLHVTLLSTSTQTPNASYFHLPAGSKAPTSVLTTSEGGGAPAPEFNSITYHGPVLTKTGEKRVNAQGETESVVKIFSAARVGDEWLERMFGGKGKVGWVLRKEWDAYPVLPPVGAGGFPPVKLEEGLYYVNAFEPLISTMETETVASRNVVDMLLREQFNAGICKPHEGGASAEQNENFVYGWDC